MTKNQTKYYQKMFFKFIVDLLNFSNKIVKRKKLKMTFL